MSEIQNFIKKYAETNKKFYITEVIDKLKNQASIWAAYSPVTKNYHIDIFEGKIAAFLFSEKEYYDAYEKKAKGKGVTVSPRECSTADRTELFMELYRSGVELLIIDEVRQYLIISLFDVIKKPDFLSIPEAQRPLLNPSLVSAADNFFQALAFKRPTKELERKLFFEIYNARYLMPLDRSQLDVENKDGETVIKKGSNIRIPMITNSEGKHFFPFFTDWIEMRKFDPQKKFAGNTVGFNDLKYFSGQGGVAVNPFGFNMILDENIIKIIESTAIGIQNAGVEKINLENSSNVLFGDPEEKPEKLLEAVSACLEKHSDVSAAYLRLMEADGVENWLLVIDLKDNAKALYQEIARAALAYSEGKNINFLKLDSKLGKEATEGAEPFYQR